MTLLWMRAKRQFRNALVAPVSVPVRTRHKANIVTTSPLTIDLGDGTPLRAHCLAGYAPVVADVVFVDNVGGDLVVIHKFSS